MQLPAIDWHAIIPFPWRVAILVGIAVAFGSFYYVKGLRHGDAKLDAFKSRVEAVGVVQNEHTANIIKQQRQITSEAQNEAITLRKSLSDYYTSTRGITPVTSVPRPPTRAGVLSFIPHATGSFDGIAEKSRPSPAVEPSNEKCPDQKQMIEACAQDALTVLLWQEWAEKQLRNDGL
jgi:hypothetical protein